MADEMTKTSNLQEALKQAASKLAEQISEATQLNVQTFTTLIDEDGKAAKPQLVAETTIDLDGDTKLTIPMRKDAGALVVEAGLLELHLGSVQNAIKYRETLLQNILNVVKTVRER
jgi:hypothetical protein